MQRQKESKARICGNITLLLHSPNGYRTHQSPSPASRFYGPVGQVLSSRTFLSGRLDVWVGGQGYLQGTRTPYLVMFHNRITNRRGKEKKPLRQLQRAERRNRYHAQVPRPAAGRSAVGPVIPRPPRAPPRARDRSGAFLPRAAPPSTHHR